MTKEHVRGKSEDGIIQNSEGLKRSKTHSRREVLVGSAAAGALVIVRGEPAAAADAKKTFTTGPSQYLHRHRRWNATGQSCHRRFPKGHEGRHRPQRQGRDARWLDAGEVGRGDRV